MVFKKNISSYGVVGGKFTHASTFNQYNSAAEQSMCMYTRPSWNTYIPSLFSSLCFFCLQPTTLTSNDLAFTSASFFYAKQGYACATYLTIMMVNKTDCTLHPLYSSSKRNIPSWSSRFSPLCHFLPHSFILYIHPLCQWDPHDILYIVFLPHLGSLSSLLPRSPFSLSLGRRAQLHRRPRRPLPAPRPLHARPPELRRSRR
jgi:hypothetical protein